MVAHRGTPLWLPRAGTQACPYENHDTVNVIRHHDECIYIKDEISLCASVGLSPDLILSCFLESPNVQCSGYIHPKCSTGNNRYHGCLFRKCPHTSVHWEKYLPRCLDLYMVDIEHTRNGRNVMNFDREKIACKFL